ncbi:MAG: MarR family winged helix-turn-helix transcriptional regulator [Eggerthellaceae bacterium]|jgi:MarR family transcriptional repressor of mepA
MDIRIGEEFKRIDIALSRVANSELATIDLTLAQFPILTLLMESPNRELFQKDIEAYLGVSHPTTTGLVKRLQEKGFVETEMSPEDSRMKIVRLTDKGLEIGKEGTRFGDVAERKMLEGFSEQERTQLASYLKRIQRNLSP